MATIRFGIVGLGNMGSGHAKFITEDKNKDFSLGEVCDIDADKAGKIGAEHNVPSFTDAEEMFASGLVDAVLIATPHYWHAPQTIQAARRGLHVLCEKPISASVGHAREMVRQCKKSRVKLGVMLHTRTAGRSITMKKMIQQGHLGEIFRVSAVCSAWYRTQFYYGTSDWRGTWDGEGGGVLINQAPHSLDLFQWLGGMPRQIIASVGTRLHKIEVENTAGALCLYEGGKTGYFYATTAESPGVDQFIFSGDKGMLILEQGKLKFAKLKGSLAKHLKTSKQSFSRPDVKWQDITWTIESQEKHIQVTRAFAANILRGTPMVATGEEAINELELSNAIYISGFKNKPVNLPVDAAEMDALLAKLERERSAMKTNLRATTNKVMKKLLAK